MSLACFNLPTFKWWPSLPPLPSATVPSEVRLVDCSRCCHGHMFHLWLTFPLYSVVATTSVFILKPNLVYFQQNSVKLLHVVSPVEWQSVLFCKMFIFQTVGQKSLNVGILVTHQKPCSILRSISICQPFMCFKCESGRTKSACSVSGVNSFTCLHASSGDVNSVVPQKHLDTAFAGADI